MTKDQAPCKSPASIKEKCARLHCLVHGERIKKPPVTSVNTDALAAEALPGKSVTCLANVTVDNIFVEFLATTLQRNFATLVTYIRQLLQGQFALLVSSTIA